MTFADVSDTIAERLRWLILHNPEWLLRQPGGGVDCDLGFIVMRDREESERMVLHRGRLPDRWLTPRMVRPSYSLTEGVGPPETTISADEWCCMSPWATLHMSPLIALPPPGIKLRDDHTYVVGLAFYEPADMYRRRKAH
jgi:hypothetical protein